MKKTFLCAISAITIFLIASANVFAKPANEPIAVEDLSRLTAIQNLSLSRDGDYMVGLIAPPGDKKAWRQSLAVWDANNLSKPPTLVQPDGKVEFIFARALKAGKILVFARKPWSGALSGCGEGNTIGSTKTYINKIFIADINDLSNFTEPFKDVRSTRGISDATKMCMEMQITAGIRQDLPLDDSEVIISRVRNSDFKTEFLKYNLVTGKSHLMFRSGGRSESIGLLDSRSGEVLTKNGRDYGDGRFTFETYIRDTSSTAVPLDAPNNISQSNDNIYVFGKLVNKRKADFKKHDKLSWDSKDRHSISVAGVNGDGSEYYILTDQFSDHVQLYAYDPVHETYGAKPLFSKDKFDVSGIIQDTTEKNFGKIIGYTYDGADSQTEWVNPRLASVQKLFQQKFPGKSVSINDYSHDKAKILVSVSSGSMPPAYYIVDGKNKTTFLGSQRPWLKKAKLADTKLVYYPARDGMEIPGLLTLPAGWKKGDKPLPAIIHPHGGPWARDFAGWDISGWVPFFTSRGFAVLQPQYRGSQGWGRKLWLAGDAQWGLKMQDDKDDGAAWLVKQGIADKNKLVIMGYSYGGFAAAAAVVRPNSPYQCAMMGAGVSELDKLSGTWSNSLIQRLLQGKTVKGMDPIQNTDKANIPLLVFHGDRDVRVPPYHGKDFYKKVKKKVPAKLVMIKDQPHSLPWTPAMQDKSLSAMDSFLKNECGIDF